MPGRTFLVSSMYGEAGIQGQLGAEHYSYDVVFRAFRPLLEELGVVTEIDRPESRIDHAIRRARADGREPLHLSFRPLQRAYLTRHAPNVAFPFWEFPDLPDEDFGDDPRNNWVRIAQNLDRIVCASAFTRDAFRHSGVDVPIDVVPVPIHESYFALPAWTAASRGTIADAPHVSIDDSRPALPPENGFLEAPYGWTELPNTPLGRAHDVARRTLRATLPASLDRAVGLTARAARQALDGWRAVSTLRLEERTLELSGIVYTSIFNPFDERKNWEDLVTAFLRALGDANDATLVLKLVLPPSLESAGFDAVLRFHRRLGIRHRCRLVIVPGRLGDAALAELTRLSTFYVTATRAESACLPLRDFLAAGRPVISPRHSALGEVLTPDCALAVDSHPEPTGWPQDPGRRMRTTWHRIVWQSLHDRLAEAHRLARDSEARYAAMAEHARERMTGLASRATIAEKLRASLSSVSDGTSALR